MRPRGEIELPSGLTLWFGRNAKKHGGQFYLGMADKHLVIASCSVEDSERHQVAEHLRKAAAAIDKVGEEKR